MIGSEAEQAEGKMDQPEGIQNTVGGLKDCLCEDERHGPCVTPLARIVLLALLGAAPAAAQNAPKTVEPSSMPLPADKHALLKEHVKRAKVPEAKVEGQVAIGMTVPEGIELWGLPQDSMTEVPTVSSYKFFHVGRTIAVVDPDSRKVIQVIRN